MDKAQPRHYHGAHHNKQGGESTMSALRLLPRLLLVLAAAAPLLATAQTAEAPWPNRPIKIIVSFPPGAGADLTARTVAQKLTESLGQPVVVDNRGGANGIIGTDLVAKSAPDGYTILLTDRGAFGVNPSLYKKLPYDPLKDFEYIGIATVGNYVLAINAGVPAKNYAEFIALAKSKPGAINYASFGVGSMPQMNIEALNLQAGIKLNHVPYKGGGPAVAALVSGEVGATVLTAPSLLGHIKEGRVRAIAIGAAKRTPLLPDVPTMAEVGGGADTLVPTYFGFAAPAGTPKAIVNRLSAEIKKALSANDAGEKLGKLGLDTAGGTPEEMFATVKSDMARFAKLVKAIGIQPE
jgi:tripartite-type tricarboxylate transporter receptor subunit TctC